MTTQPGPGDPSGIPVPVVQAILGEFVALGLPRDTPFWLAELKESDIEGRWEASVWILEDPARSPVLHGFYRRGPLLGHMGPIELPVEPSIEPRDDPTRETVILQAARDRVLGLIEDGASLSTEDMAFGYRLGIKEAAGAVMYRAVGRVVVEIHPSPESKADPAAQTQDSGHPLESEESFEAFLKGILKANGIDIDGPPVLVAVSVITREDRDHEPSFSYDRIAGTVQSLQSLDRLGFLPPAERLPLINEIRQELGRRPLEERPPSMIDMVRAIVRDEISRVIPWPEKLTAENHDRLKSICPEAYEVALEIDRLTGEAWAKRDRNLARKVGEPIEQLTAIELALLERHFYRTGEL